jgi:HEAT repeat protein
VVREWTAAALEEIATSMVVPYLVESLKSDIMREGKAQGFAAALRGLNASDSFFRLLGHSDPMFEHGDHWPGRLRCEEALDCVAERYQDEDPEVRRRAAAFMGEVESERALDFLEQALEDMEMATREQALKSICRFKTKRACNLAASALKDEMSQIRLAAVTSLGEIGHTSAVQDLIDVMLGEDFEEEVRAWAAWSLGEIKDKRAVGPLLEACKSSPPEVQKKARDSLREVFGVEI